MKKDFYEQPLYTISNYFIGFFLSSIYFSICNIPLVLFLFLITLVPDNFNFLIFFICLIPLGPALGTLYATFSKMVREKDIYSSSYFWHFYKNNFISYLKFWTIIILVGAILLFDVKYFYTNFDTSLYIIFAILAVFTLLIGLYGIAINSRFTLKLKDLIGLSLFYAMKKLPTSILKIFVLGATFYVVKDFSLFILTFIPGILCFIFYYYDRNMLNEIEKNLRIK